MTSRIALCAGSFLLMVFLAVSVATADMIDDCDKSLDPFTESGELKDDKTLLENQNIKISGCTKVIETSKDNELVAAAHNNRGFAYLASQKAEEALADYDKAIQLAPGNGTYYKNRGTLYFHYLNQPEAALADYTQGISYAPEDASIYMARGVLHMNVGRGDDALEDFDKAIELNPDLPASYFNRATVYQQMRRYDLAIIDLTQCIRLEHQLVRSYAMRGLAHEMTGLRDKAVADYQSALEVRPLLVSHDQVREVARTRLKALGASP